MLYIFVMCILVNQRYLWCSPEMATQTAASKGITSLYFALHLPLKVDFCNVFIVLVLLHVEEVQVS